MKTHKYLCYFLLFSFFTALPIKGLAQNLFIDPERTGSITITKYAVDNQEDYDAPATGEQQNVQGLPPLPGISFTVTRVQDTDETPGDATPFEGSGAYSKTLSTDENGVAHFNPLPQGVYLVKEEFNPAVHAPVEDFLVSVPLTNPQGSGWLYDIYVYPKNQLAATPGIQMFIDQSGNSSASVGLGATVTWLVLADIPKDIGQAVHFQIVTGINPALSLQPESIQVYAQSGQTKTPLERTADYEATEANPLDITLTPKGKTALTGLLQEGEPPLLTMEFDTVFHLPEENLSEFLGAEIAKTAQLNYTNALGIAYTAITEDPPYVYTGGLSILKTDGKTAALLPGAKFKLYPSSEDAYEGRNAIPAPNSAQDWEITTDNNGRALFYGLPYENETAYYLVETQAPSGYNLLRGPQEVTVSSVSHLEENAAVIKDYTGFTLPMTGGTGTFLFIVAGLGCILAALFLFFRKKNRV